MRRCVLAVAAVVLGFLSLAPEHVRADGRITTLVGTGSVGFNGDKDGLATNINPYALDVAQNGDIYFTDRVRIRRYIAETNRVETLVGSLPTQPVERPEDAINPISIAIDHKSGDVYFADGRGNAILRLTPELKVEKVAGTGHAPNFDSTPADGPALEADIDPSQIVFDQILGRLFFIDRGRWVRQADRGYDAKGPFKIETVAGPRDHHARPFREGILYVARREIGPNVVINPQGLAVNPMSADIFFGDNGPIRRLPASDGYRVVTEAVPGHVRCGIPTDISPQDLAIDPIHSDIYIADAGRSKIRRIHFNGGGQCPSWGQVNEVAGVGFNSGPGSLEDGDARDSRIYVTAMAFRPRTKWKEEPEDLIFIDSEARIRQLKMPAARR